MKIYKKKKKLQKKKIIFDNLKTKNFDHEFLHEFFCPIVEWRGLANGKKSRIWAKWSSASIGNLVTTGIMLSSQFFPATTRTTFATFFAIWACDNRCMGHFTSIPFNFPTSEFKIGSIVVQFGFWNKNSFCKQFSKLNTLLVSWFYLSRFHFYMTQLGQVRMGRRGEGGEGGRRENLNESRGEGVFLRSPTWGLVFRWLIFHYQMGLSSFQMGILESGGGGALCPLLPLRRPPLLHLDIRSYLVINFLQLFAQ